MPLRKISSKGPMYRSFELDRSAINEEDRTVELSFSSETQDVERWFGIEILDHSPASVRLARLKNSGPLLFLHNMRDHIGVIEEVSIEKLKGKALVRFGTSPLAEEKFQDVKDGVLVHVSFGYRVFKMVLEERGDDTPDIYRVIDWEPYEISLLPVPADIDVGVGRAAGESFDIEIEDRTMPEENKGGAPDNQTRGVETPPVQAAPIAAPAVDVRVIENAAVTADRQRVADITAMGERFKKYGARDLVAEHTIKDTTVEQFRAIIMERLPTEDKAGSGEQPADTRLDLSARDIDNYSLLRALRGVIAVRKGDAKGMKEAGFELECSRELSERLGRDANGIFIPIDVMSRVMNATNNADLIGTQHMGDMFIDTLRPMSVVMGLGVTVMDGLEGNLEIPRALSNPTFGWIGDDDDAGLSDGGTGLIKMAPKTLAGGVPMSRRLLKQSSPSVERVITNALLKGAALGVDLAVLAGTGTNNEPLGVSNISGINTQAVAAPGSPTWAELVGFESTIAADNALEGSLAYVTTSGVRGNLKTTKKDAGSGIFLLENGEANGHKLAMSNQLAANTILFGNWADAYVGFWGVIDVNPDMAAKASSGGMILRVFQDADVSIGHAESFCKNTQL